MEGPTSSSSDSKLSEKEQKKRELLVFEDSEHSNNNKKSKVDDIALEGKFQVNEYKGWVVPENNFKIPAISIEDLTPEKFYSDYVSRRKPVVLRGELEDLSGLKKWKVNNDHLRNLAGEEKVMVEVRSNEKESFGRGNETPMTFNAFLDSIEKGDSMHYLTTQDVEANEDGQPDLMAPFMKRMKGDFPLRPKIMGNLIPQNINMWFGNSKDGASSGLHHDYHDNLYILLRGTKRFRLYSPKDTENLYSKGKLLKVHHNGRINYEGEETTPYGADLKADAAAKASRAKEEAEHMLIEAEKKVQNGIQGAQEELEQAEEMLEMAMDALIDAEMDDDDDDDDDEINEEDDGNDEAVYFSDDSKSSGTELSPKRVRYLVDKTIKDPNNFSNIAPVTLSEEAKIHDEFPLIERTKAAFCDITAGELLYLPASWWHEVTSIGDGPQGHLAINYWFHPPDVNDNYMKPYSTEFWPEDYKLRLEKS